MRIEITHTQHETCSAEFIETRLQAALDTFAERVQRIRVTTGDVNAAKGGCDKTCRLTARLQDGEVITVSDRRPDLQAAVTWAAGKLAEAVRRRMERRNGRRRSRPSFGDLPEDFTVGGDFDDSGNSPQSDDSPR